MSKQLSSDAKARGETHPYYVLPNFEVVGSAIRKQSHVEVIAYAPILESADEIPAWIEYTLREDHNWLENSVNAAIESGESSAESYQVGAFAPVVFNVDDSGNPYPAEGPGPFAPLWQLSPPPFQPGSVNYNLLDFDFGVGGLEVFNRTRRAHFSRIVVPEEVHNIQELVMSRNDHDAAHRKWTLNGNGTNPHSVYTVPVFEDPFNVESKLVGFLMAYFSWDSYMDNLLPDGVRGIFCVVRNTCGQAITYEIVGNSVSGTIPRIRITVINELRAFISHLASFASAQYRLFTLARVTTMTNATLRRKRSCHFSRVNPRWTNGTQRSVNTTLCFMLRSLLKNHTELTSPL